MAEPTGDRKRRYSDNVADGEQLGPGGEGVVPGLASESATAWPTVNVESNAKRQKHEVTDPMANCSKPDAVATKAVALVAESAPSLQGTNVESGLKQLGVQPADSAINKGSTPAGGATSTSATTHSFKPSPQLKMGSNPNGVSEKLSSKQVLLSLQKTTGQLLPNSNVPQPRKESPPPPFKSSTFHHLRKKYGPELDYMLVEFRKLERQLLGAPAIQQMNKSNNLNGKQPPKKVETAGSRERREKLQGFISHLEDTIRQITEGCLSEENEQLNASNEADANANDTALSTQPQHQEEKKSSDTFIREQTVAGADPPREFTAEEASLSRLPPEKEKEESVQRLEEHILANLLPVKARLTRQLAAQKGATKNPVTAPLSARHGHLRNSEAVGTIKEEAEAKRKAILLQQQPQQHLHWRTMAGPATDAVSVANAAGPAATPSQYGKPLGQAGSSLTARLHGTVLGASKTVDSPTNVPTSTPGAAVGASPAKVHSSATQATNAATNATFNNFVSPNKRRILYAGIAPGSTQVPSSVNAVSGAHPGFVGEEAAKAVALAEEEKKKLQTLEESAARVGLGVGSASAGTVAAGSLKSVAPVTDPNEKAAVPKPAHSTTPLSAKSALLAPNAQSPFPKQATAASKSPYEGPATLAARARAQQAATALAAARARNSVVSKSQPNQPIPPITKIPGTSVHSGAQYTAMLPQYHLKTNDMTRANVLPPPNAGHQIHPQTCVPHSAKPSPFTSAAVAKLPVKKKKPYTTPDFNDPSLSPAQQFDLRLSEARRRQRKRRRARRRQRKTAELDRTALIQRLSPQSHAFQQQQQQQQQQQRILNDGTLAYASSMAACRSRGYGGSPGGSMTAAAPQMASNGSFGARTVEYVCAICNEPYPSSCDMNPWWALSSQECPKCGKNQIPRLDISAPANLIEYHPALLAHLDENNGSIASDNTAGVNSSPSKSQQQSMQGSYLTRQPPIMNGQRSSTICSSYSIRKTATYSDSEVSVTDESDGEGGSGDYSYESSDDDETWGDNNDGNSIEREECVEREDFGFDYKGEKLTDDQARKLLVLIDHASTCPGRHRSSKHRNVCHSTKYLMLHVRDCSGLLSNGDICPFPWCRKVKHLLYHLVSCRRDSSDVCFICCTQNISPNFDRLVGLNNHRRKNNMKRSKAFAAAAAQRQMAASNTQKVGLVHRPPAKAPATQLPQCSYHGKHPQDIAPATYRSPKAQPKIKPTPKPPPLSIPAYTSIPIPSTLAAPSPSQAAATAHTKTYPTATCAMPVHTAQTNHVAQSHQPTQSEVSTQRTVYAANPLSPNQDIFRGTRGTIQRNDSSALEPLPSPSPAFTALPSSMSALSVFNLEEPVVDIGDVDLSSSDLISHLEPADVNTLCDENQAISSPSEIKGSSSNDGPATQALSSTGTTV